MELHEPKIICKVKDTTIQVKRQSTEQKENIFTTYFCDRVLVSRKHKELKAKQNKSTKK